MRIQGQLGQIGHSEPGVHCSGADSARRRSVGSPSRVLDGRDAQRCHFGVTGHFCILKSQVIFKFVQSPTHCNTPLLSNSQV